MSIVMPSLNAARWIGRAVESALSQRRVELELVVQDGGSSDGTLAVLDRLAEPRLLVESGPDEGQSDALNRAIERSRGEWIAWLNADDELVPGSLATALAAATPGIDVLIGDFTTIDEGGNAHRVHRGAALDRRRLLSRGCYAFTGATLIRRRVFAANGGLDPSLHYAMDYEFFLRNAARRVRERADAGRALPAPCGDEEQHRPLADVPRGGPDPPHLRGDAPDPVAVVDRAGPARPLPRGRGAHASQARAAACGSRTNAYEVGGSVRLPPRIGSGARSVLIRPALLARRRRPLSSTSVP